MPAAVQYYYVPEIDGYYDVPAQRYIVPRNGQWVPVAVMPGYNLAHFHPVVVDYWGQSWTQYRDHHARYYRPVVMKQRPVVVDRGNRGHNDHADCGRGPAERPPRSTNASPTSGAFCIYRGCLMHLSAHWAGWPTN